MDTYKLLSSEEIFTNTYEEFIFMIQFSPV